MALNKEFKDYSYNLGRAVAVVEIINGLRQTFASDVANNAKDKLPYQLTEALKKHTHNIHKELTGPADVVLNHGELPSKPVTAIDPMGRYWIGYYHEKAYLADTYHDYYELTGDVGLERLIDNNISKKISMSEYLKKITKEELRKEL